MDKCIFMCKSVQPDEVTIINYSSQWKKQDIIHASEFAYYSTIQLYTVKSSDLRSHEKSHRGQFREDIIRWTVSTFIYNYYLYIIVAELGLEDDHEIVVADVTTPKPVTLTVKFIYSMEWLSVFTFCVTVSSVDIDITNLLRISRS